MLLSFLLLGACNPFDETEPTVEPEVLEIVQMLPPTTIPTTTRTPIPFPSPTPTRTPFPSPTVDSTVVAVTVVAAIATADAELPKVEILTTALYLRAGPGTANEVIASTVSGEQWPVLGIDVTGDWYQVQLGEDAVAWLSSDAAYTQLVNVSQPELSVIQAITPQATGQNNKLNQIVSTPIRPISPEKDQVGQLIFVNRSGGTLYRANLDGMNVTKLAEGVIDPVVSPDGQQIAFTRWDGAKVGTLYTINLDGTNERVIMGEMLEAKSPAWSPNNQEIVLSFQHGGIRDPDEICKQYDFDDGIRIPTNAQITSFQTTADGITVCYVRLEDLHWGLRKVDVATGDFEDLPADRYSYNPTWDPKNPWRVLYDGDKGLMQLDVTTESLWPITTDVRDTGPVFSPDGQLIALTYKQHDHWEVYTLHVEENSRQRLTKPSFLAKPQFNSAAPAWSPDGRTLAFLTDRTGAWEIWVMAADGSDPRPLFDPVLQAEWDLQYNGVNERMLNWVE